MIKMALGVLGIVMSLHSPPQSFASINQETMINPTVIVNEIEDIREYIEVDCVLTFYTSLASCNSASNVGRNAIGGYLSKTSIAIPRKSMEYGTDITLDSLPESLSEDYNDMSLLNRVADDCGNKQYIKITNEGIYRFDIYCERLSGETDKEYHSRVTSYGKHTTTAKIYIEKEEK